jgi:hypothetical protein
MTTESEFIDLRQPRTLGDILAKGRQTMLKGIAYRRKVLAGETSPNPAPRVARLRKAMIAQDQAWRSLLGLPAAKRTSVAPAPAAPVEPGT